jgi:hypothetical protein
MDPFFRLPQPRQQIKTFPNQHSHSALLGERKFCAPNKYATIHLKSKLVKLTFHYRAMSRRRENFSRAISLPRQWHGITEIKRLENDARYRGNINFYDAEKREKSFERAL